MIRRLLLYRPFNGPSHKSLYRPFPGQYVHRLIITFVICFAVLSTNHLTPSAQEADAKTESESETETETEPDPRILWYMDNIPDASAFIPTDSGNARSDSSDIGTDTSDSPDTAEKVSGSSQQSDKAVVSDKLKTLVETDSAKRLKRRRRIRRKLAAYMQEHLGIILSEMYAVHYIYTDETDYLVTFIADIPYIYAFEITDRGRVTILETDPDEDIRTTLLELAMADPSSSDIHYWNGICTTAGEEAALKTLPVSDDGARAVPYFNQGLGFWNGTDGWICTDWPVTTFDINGHTMKEAGCGFFAAAMAISYIRQEIIPPIDFKENGQYTGNGAAVTVGLESAGMYGVKAVITANWEEAYAALREGHIVMENVGPGTFARYGHFILLTGILEDGRIVVNDPGNEYHTYWYNWEAFEPSLFPDNRHDSDTPYTIFG